MMPHLLFEMALRGLIADGETLRLGARRATPRLAGHRRRDRPARRPRPGWCSPRPASRPSPAAPRSPHLPLRSRRHAHAPARRPAASASNAAITRVGNVTHFATVDHNPIAAFEAHPNKGGNHRRPRRPAGSGVDRRCSTRRSRSSRRSCPQTFAEMRLMLHEVVPVGYDDERHLSASYREAIGTMYLTLHPNVMTMTEAVVHEFQHNKFNVASVQRRLPRQRVPPALPEPDPPGSPPAVGHSPRGARVPARRGALPSHARRRAPVGGASRLRSAPVRASISRTTRAWRCYAPTPSSPRPASPCSRELEALEQRHLAERTARGLSNVPTEVHLA